MQYAESAIIFPGVHMMQSTGVVPIYAWCWEYVRLRIESNHYWLVRKMFNALSLGTTFSSPWGRSSEENSMEGGEGHVDVWCLCATLFHRSLRSGLDRFFSHASDCFDSLWECNCSVFLSSSTIERLRSLNKCAPLRSACFQLRFRMPSPD